MRYRDLAQDGCIARKLVAPKILSRNDKPYTERYNIGCSSGVLYVMLAGEPPLGQDTQPDAETLERIKKGKFDFDAMPEGTSEHVIDLIKNMILEKPEKRLSTSEAAHSPGCDPLNPDRMNATKNKKTMNMMRKFRNQGKSKRAALQVVAQQLPVDSVEEPRQVVPQMGNDMTGQLTVAQTEEVVEESGAADEMVLKETRVMLRDPASQNTANDLRAGGRTTPRSSRPRVTAGST